MFAQITLPLVAANRRTYSSFVIPPRTLNSQNSTLNLQPVSLTRTALLGTARTELPPPANAAEERVAGVSDEAAVLLRAAASDVWAEAGRVPEDAPDPPPVCPADPRPAPPPVVVRAAEKIFADHRGLIAELSERLSATGHRLPHELLVAALDLTPAADRDAVRPVLGERGRWLAAFGEAAHWAAGPAVDADDPESLALAWEEGDLPARRVALAAYRAADAADGRAKLEAVWNGERAAGRAVLVKQLAVGLSAEDEPFLTECLKDRSRFVRDAAADLLCTLPDSRFAGRMREHADGAVSIAGKLRKTLSVTVPDDIATVVAGDGLTLSDTPPKPLGRRAFRFVQVMEYVPPSHWEHRFSLPPGDLLAAASRGEDADALRAGWLRAAKRFADAGWLAALARHAVAGQKTLREDALAPLLELLPDLVPADAAAVAAELLGQRKFPRESIPTLAAAVPGPWPPAFADDLLAAARRAVHGGRRTAWAWTETLPTLAAKLPPSRLAAATEGWAIPEKDAWETQRWRSAVEKLTEIVRLRRVLYEEFN